MDNVRLLSILDGLTSRVDAKREPVGGLPRDPTAGEAGGSIRLCGSFDPVWLRNAVLEPLKEADIEVKREK